MWSYERMLQFPVNIKKKDGRAAQVIMSQYGGPDGEIAASMRYLSQRYATPYREVAGLLTDIGTEELAHMEMVAAIVHQLTRDLSMEEIEASGLAPYYVDHTVGIWPQAAGGIPFNACEFQSKGDIITDLFEDMAADDNTSLVQYRIIGLVDKGLICLVKAFYGDWNIIIQGRITPLMGVFKTKAPKDIQSFSDHLGEVACRRNRITYTGKN